MNKKEYVLKALDMIKNSFPLADGLIFLINQYGVDDNFLDVLIKSFDQSLKNLEDGEMKSKLEKSKSFFEELKSQEFDEENQDKKRLEQLDDMLKNI